jgi:translation initiation factor 3 subunit H
MASQLKEADFDPVRQVVVEGVAILKIVKHCKEALPQLASGKLLGLEHDGLVEVTNCFPMPVASEDGKEEDQAGTFRFVLAVVLFL